MTTTEPCQDREDCVEWPGARDANGRGLAIVRGKRSTAARLAYENAVGKIPRGAQVTQDCGNLACCQPSHLALKHRGVGLPLRERFMRHVDISVGCWAWLGSVDSHGYGQLTVDKRRRGAHRVSHELFKGAIPAGLEIDHLCRNRTCVNPDHLEAVTPHENTYRSSSPFALLMSPEGPKREHGTSSMWRRGCRCGACHEALLIAAREWREGSRRRHPTSTLCAGCGKSVSRKNLARHRKSCANTASKESS